ncbi:MAG: peptidoglycan-binding domain-containing protein, partial [Pseudomonadota bacterium]
MKTVLSLAVLCAMAATPALAAGGMQRSGSMDQPYRSQQQGMMEGQQQQQTSQAPSQALDESMVRQIQQQLQGQGFEVQTDGIFGPNTRQALRQFQQEQGMQATGRVDMNTLAALGVVEGGTQQALF